MNTLIELADAYAESVAQRTITKRVNARAALVQAIESLQAEVERLKRQSDARDANIFHLNERVQILTKNCWDVSLDRDALRAELAKLKGAEPVAYVMEFNDGTTTIQKTAYWDCKAVTPLYAGAAPQAPTPTGETK